jgi:hypothetical protein
MARHKATVVAAVRAGRITMEEALHRYRLSEEEFRSWQRALESHGLPVCGQPSSSNIVNRVSRGEYENASRAQTCLRRNS